MKALNSKNLKTVEKAAQVEEKLRPRVTSLVLELRTEKDCIARFEEDCIDEHTEDREAAVGRQKALGALKDQLSDMVGTLRQVRAALTVASDKLETLCFRSENAKKELSFAQTNVSL